jgi:hypothetical protein
MEPFENDEPAEATAATLDELLGSLTGLYDGFDLDALRAEWQRLD